MKRLAVVALLLAGCAAPQPPAPVTGGRPRLAVVIVVDGLPQRQVTDYRDQLAPDGLERFFSRGAWYTDAHYGYANTETAPGHATILTGAYPHRTGIVANQWIDPATGTLEYCADDPAATWIGHRTARLDGTSPRKLLAESLGDVLKSADARSKVVSVAGKDRAAILTAGRNGTAYVYQAQSGKFASTTYYMKAHPKWVDDFNDKRPADAYFGVEWKPLLIESAYARSLPDDRKWYGRGGKLPKKMGAGMVRPGPNFYADLLGSPFSDDLTLAFARAAVAGEGLGKDDAPDLLIVGLSGHDFVNHGYGAESRISHDHLLYLDRALQDFFNDLDVAIGRDNYVAVLSADHGFVPAPEHSQSLGRDAGRVNPVQLLRSLNAALAKRFGEGAWARGWSAQGLMLDHALARDRKVALADVAEETRRLLVAEPGVAAVYTRAQVEGAAPKGAPFLDAVRNSWYPARSPDLQVVLKPYWVMSSSPNFTTHGSPHPYDTNVPILLYGPSWVTLGRVDTRVEVSGIAPTLAAILGVRAPAQSEGKRLPLP